MSLAQQLLQGCHQDGLWDCSHCKDGQGRICLQSHSEGCWQGSVPPRLLEWVSQFWLAVGQELPSVLCHTSLSIGQLTNGNLLHWNKYSRRAGENTQEWGHSLYNLRSIWHPITVATLPRKPILFYSVQLTYGAGGRIIQRCDYQEVGIIGSHVRKLPTMGRALYTDLGEQHSRRWE